MSPFVALVVSMGFLIGDVSCVAITADKIMRKESKTEDAMEMFASGGMHKAEATTSEHDMCNIDYPLGTPGTCGCIDGTMQSIGREDLCEEAAFEANVVTNKFQFVISDLYYHEHPKGCFKDSCTVDGVSQQCYFFNPIGVMPAGCGGDLLQNMQVAPTITGVPVCHRKQYSNGTTNGVGSFDKDTTTRGGCPVDYNVIDNYDDCSNAYECTNFCRGQPFNVTDKDQDANFHHDFPVGCFINDGDFNGADGCVYFNSPLVKTTESPNNTAHTGAKSVSVCHVTTKNWLNGGGANGTGTDVHLRSGQATNMTEKRSFCSTYPVTSCPTGQKLIAANATTPCAANPCVDDDVHRCCEMH